jgi:hypothetical protein
LVSTLYQFSSEGAFPSTPVSLYAPSASDTIKVLSDNKTDLFALAKNYILVDRLNFISHIVHNESCTKCNYEKTLKDYVPDLNPPYTRFLNTKTKLVPLWASKIVNALTNDINIESILSYD